MSTGYESRLIGRAMLVASSYLHCTRDFLRSQVDGVVFNLKSIITVIYP
jgi:ATP phosphoribosyltransferase